MIWFSNFGMDDVLTLKYFFGFLIGMGSESVFFGEGDKW